MPERGHARLNLLIALADDDLIIGHRHSEWTGWAPMIEADLAFSSIAQDEIAHARLLYELAEPIDGRTPDELALGRPPAEYRNAIFCERDNKEWGYTLARQYLYDTADDVRLSDLESSSWEELSRAVAVIRLEEQFHLDHAHAWFKRIGSGPEDVRRHLIEGLAEAAKEAAAVFEPVWDEEQLLRDGTMPHPSAELAERWLERVRNELEGWGIEVPELGDAARGGRTGTRSEDFTSLWEDLTGLYRTHTGATW